MPGGGSGGSGGGGATENINMLVMSDKLSGIEEESDMYDAFAPHVDPTQIPVVVDSPAGKKPALKSFKEMEKIVAEGKKRDLKAAIRENSWPINSPVRAQLWPLLCSQHQLGKSMLEGFYWDMVNQVFGTTELPEKPIMLPPFVDSTHCLPFHLTSKGRAVADRVVTVLAYACPDITFSPILYPITAVLLHFMSEEECYHCLASLVASKEKVFITQTKLLHEVTWKTVMQISKKHAKSATTNLQRMCPGQRIEPIFMGWYWWILGSLPFPHLVRIMDCYFNEGIKVFYRIAIAVLILFNKHAAPALLAAGGTGGQGSSGGASTSQAAAAAEAASASGSTKNGVNGGAAGDYEDDGGSGGLLATEDIIRLLPNFCKSIPVSPSKLLRTAFSIRALSSTYISRVFIKTEMLLKSRSVLSGSKQLVRSRSSDNLPTSQSQVNIQMMSHTLTIREGAHSPGPRAKSMGVYPIQTLKSQVLDHDDDALLHSLASFTLAIPEQTPHQKLFTLWSWLPVRITMYQPVLLYTTEEHGCSLTTFYVRVEQHEPTLLMIKTCNNEVFGAYCSSRWFERNLKDDKGNRQAYFGTGETFLFSLFPERARYPWVGIEGDKGLGHGSELFMAADAKMITIGGGEGQAIWMDENIRFGKTDRCQTFNNPPLCPSGDFEIRVLEVYGFVGA